MHTKRRPSNNMNGGGNGQHRHNNNNRPRRFPNSRPQGGEGGGDTASIARTRRNALQSREKYQQMARDAMSMGDRVLSENYLQHADHYHRVILSLPPEEVRQPYQPREQRPQGEPGANGEQQHASEHPNVPYSSEPSDNNDSVSTHQQGDSHSVAHELPSFITQPINPEEQ